jgi:hypothetical protein
MRCVRLGGLTALLLVMGLGGAAPAAETVARPIKYADLGKMVRAQRGKVVLVDFWSVY